MLSNPAEKRGWGWARCCAGWVGELRLALWCLWWLLVARLVLLGLVRTEWEAETGLKDVVTALLQGMRFDGKIAGVIAIPGILLGIIALFVDIAALQRRWRLVMGTVFASATVLITQIDYCYWQEYHNQFDIFLLGSITDDQGAVAGTIWKAYPVLRILVVWVVVSVAAGWLWIRLEGWRSLRAESVRGRPRWLRIALTVVIPLLVVVGVRGKLGGGRPLTFSAAAVTGDPVLNRLVPNPWSALANAVAEVRAVTGKAAALSHILPGENIHAAAERYFGAADIQDLDVATRRVAAGPTQTPPQHVVLILGESLSGWFLEDRYASIGLGDGVRDLAAKGVHLRDFLSSDIGTIGSYATLVTGLPLPDVPINYQTSAREPFPTSIAPIFKALGYRTRCFYAGFDSWQRLGDFTRAQGFDEVFAAGDFPDLLAGSQWGAADRTLFNEALKRLDPNEPSFSLILTVSNHSPFEIDMEREGWKRTAMPNDLSDIDDGTADWFALGHAWYASRCIGEFVAQAEQRLGESLCVAITGDHYGRRFLNGRPSRWERTMVPFIGYGAGFRDVTVPDGAIGSHVDMVTTLIERCAPAGFVYHAWGHDLLTPRRDPVAFGRWCALDAQGVIDFKEPVAERDARWKHLEAGYRDQAALSWWRVMRGAALPP